MDPQKVLEISSAANAVAMGNGDAITVNKTRFNNAIKVRTEMNSQAKGLLDKMCDFNYVYLGGNNAVNDHQTLCACREIARQVYDGMAKPATTCVKTLVVGTSDKEIKKYSANPNVHYHFHGKDNKDYHRTISEALEVISSELLKKAKKKDRHFFLPPRTDPEYDKLVKVARPVVKRYMTNKQILDDYTVYKQMPPNIHTDYVEANTLLFEDSIYNFTANDIAVAFLRTGARMAFGYAFLPNELIFDDMPSNPLYRYERQGADAYVFYKNGYSNSYTHKWEAWSTLLRSPAYQFRVRTRVGEEEVDTAARLIAEGTAEKDVLRCLEGEESFDFSTRKQERWSKIGFGVEIVSRIGPMAVFKLYRCDHPEKIVRQLELANHERYVQLLDSYASVDHHTCKFKYTKVYFSVLETEFWEAYNYMIRLPDASMTPQNLFSYVVRRMFGVSLTTRELVPPWFLPPSDVQRFCVAVYMQAYIMSGKYKEIFAKANPTSIYEKIKQFFAAAMTTVFYPVSILIDMIFSEHLTDRVVLFPMGRLSQVQIAEIVPDMTLTHIKLTYGMIPPENEEVDDINNIINSGPTAPTGIEAPVEGMTRVNLVPAHDMPVCMPSEVDPLSKVVKEFKVNTHCEFCMAATGHFYRRYKLAKGLGIETVMQRMKCCAKANSVHKYSLTNQDLGNLFESLATTDKDAPKLGEVKELAKQSLPKTGFSIPCETMLVQAGPGTGKSDLIRGMANVERDVVLAPFSKLMVDYRGVSTPKQTAQNWNDEHPEAPVTEEYVDFVFKTQHRAMTLRAADTVWVDEFTAFPYEYLACVVHNCRPRRVVLCGDFKQTKIREGKEGMYMFNHIKLAELSRHDLLVNYRNPKDAVALLNSKFGYEMIAASKKDNGFEIIDYKKYNELMKPNPDNTTTPLTELTFGTVHAGEIEGSTVRSCQGSTYKNVVVHFRDEYHSLFNMDEMVIVALSRHTDKCYILSDNSSSARTRLLQLGVDKGLNAQYGVNLIDERTPVPTIATIPVDLARDVEVVVPPEPHPTHDAFLLASTFLPDAATQPDCVPLNFGHASMVDPNFVSGKTTIEHMIAPTNMRGHPIKQEYDFYSMFAGAGIHFDGKDPFPELASLVGRYLGVKPNAKPLDAEGVELANWMVDKFMEDWKVPNLAVVVGKLWDDQDWMEEIAKKFVISMQQKNYLGRVTPDQIDGRTVRYHMKRIYKPAGSFKTFSLNKGGQGISGCCPELLLMFCLYYRILAEVDNRTYRKDDKAFVCSKFGMTDIEFAEECVKANNLVNPKAYPIQNACQDGEKLDMVRNAFNDTIEKRYHVAMGGNPLVIDHFLNLRSDYWMISAVASAAVKGSYSSGFPGTELGVRDNFSVVCNSYLEVPEGGRILYTTGDDDNTAALQVKINEKLKRQILEYYPVKITCKIGATGEFCGMTVTPAGVAPNLLRRLNKFVSCHYRDFKHFCEAQIALRDYINMVKNTGSQKAIANTQWVNNMSYKEALGVYECLVSFSHINKIQFESVVKHVTLDKIIIAANTRGITSQFHW